MKRTLLIATALVSLTAAAPALAQGYGNQGYGNQGYGPPRGAQNGWQSINNRQAQLDQRIDVGLRNGQLTRAEAQRLRVEFRTIADLEARYRQTGGLDLRERADLDRRFDALSARIRFERADNQTQGRGPGRGDVWNINARQAQLNNWIDRGVRNGNLDRNEATRLRIDFQNIANLEARYRRDGLDQRERADLDRRFDSLESRLRIDMADRSFRWDDGYRYR